MSGQQKPYRVHGMTQSCFTAQAGSIPEYEAPPRPALNRPFPAADR